MKLSLTASIWASTLLTQQALATWADANKYSNPYNADNECSDEQQNGFDWKQAPLGPIKTYADVSLSGFVCVDNFTPGYTGYGGRKRSVQIRGDFNKKCIQAKANREQTNGPQIASAPNKKMSITEMQITVDQDADLDFHFDMPDGSICKKTQRCTAAGTVVSNDQCGGAKAVRVHVNKNGKRDCEFGIHQVKFDCKPNQYPQQPPAYTTTTTVQKTTNNPYETTKTTDVYKPTTTTTTTTTTMDKYDTTTKNQKTTDQYKDTTTTTTTSTMDKHDTTTTTMDKHDTTTYDYDHTTEVYKTTTRDKYTTTKEIQNPYTSRPRTTHKNTDDYYDYTTSQSTTYCDKCDDKPTTTYAQSKPTSPPEDVPCPKVLPRCINTWLEALPSCKTNSDVGCFCPELKFIKKVQECIYAWGEDEDELQAAYSFLAGICAEFVPKNPAICTGIPKWITMTPNPHLPHQTVYTTVGSHVQAVTITQTGSATRVDQKTTVTWYATKSGVVTSGAVTVPKVVFTTADPTPYTTTDDNGYPYVTVNAEKSIGLVQGIPTVPAMTTTTTSDNPYQTGFQTTGSKNMTTPWLPPKFTTTTGSPVAQYTGAAVAVNANLKVAGLLAVAALLI